MLSKASLLILGIIAEKSINPYEINKILEYIHVERWLPVAGSSVYATIKTLSGKGLIRGETRKEGNMPEKTVYSITEEGKEVFQNSLVDYFSSPLLDREMQNVAMHFVCHLEREHVADLLQQRIVKLKAAKEGIEVQWTLLQKEESVPEVSKALVRGNAKRYEAEIEITGDLLGAVQSEPEWDHFLTNELNSNHN